MSTENLIAFQTRAATDVDLQQKVLAIHQNAARELAEKIAALSLEAGTPFTVEEFLTPSELSDDQLDRVVGGSGTSGGFFETFFPSSAASRLANEQALAQLRNSHLWGVNAPTEAFPPR